ncbi:histidinol-phosphate transaminase [Wenzhouxiangella sp. AB-CW3]|uniref:histidinol-phosphate transaminase n=1 Tax=Wenzhouxiangella sp. AB-CW3 TaxID=2771012 RepID=UPI00168AA442|nr:histidinol-phosphate transaminase [Wenzhouxiangella sp. AB-CW3]QOC22538.1 histidinol-phosphate transaminase [Wenzhouxiangella sp. AB-CW3]
MSIANLARPEVLALQPYASARRLADSDGILLNANENPWAPNTEGLPLNRYPDPQPEDLRQALATEYGVDPGQLLITRGSDEGIDLLVRSFCRPDTDRVLICPPCFGMYALSARVQGARVREVPLIETDGDFQADFDRIASESPCRLYFLCSPNNPTGNELPAEAVTTLAEKVKGHGLVVVDEAYQEFGTRPSLSAQVQHSSNLVVLRTLSKAFGLAGCRIGVVIAHPEVIGILGRIIAPYPLPTPAVEAALAALSPEGRDKRDKQLARLATEKSRLVEALEQHPAMLRVWPGAANFVLVRTRPGAGLVEAAAAAGIRLRDQSAQPGLTDCVRITVGSPSENEQLMTFLGEWQT